MYKISIFFFHQLLRLPRAHILTFYFTKSRNSPRGGHGDVQPSVSSRAATNMGSAVSSRDRSAIGSRVSSSVDSAEGARVERRVLRNSLDRRLAYELGRRLGRGRARALGRGRLGGELGLRLDRRWARSRPRRRGRRRARPEAARCARVIASSHRCTISGCRDESAASHAPLLVPGAARVHTKHEKVTITVRHTYQLESSTRATRSTEVHGGLVTMRGESLAIVSSHSRVYLPGCRSHRPG